MIKLFKQNLVENAKFINDDNLVYSINDTVAMLQYAIDKNENKLNKGNPFFREPKHAVIVEEYNWVAQTRGNYIFTLEFLESLLNEYKFRFGETPKASNLLFDFDYGILSIPLGKLDLSDRFLSETEKDFVLSHLVSNLIKGMPPRWAGVEKSEEDLVSFFEGIRGR